MKIWAQGIDPRFDRKCSLVILLLEEKEMHIGMITCQNLDRYFVSSQFPYFTRDDQELVNGLLANHWEVSPVFWGCSVQEIKNQGIDVLVMRSPWDYADSAKNRSLFKEWLSELDQSDLIVHNKPALMLWNLDKHYLQDLSVVGVPVVETTYLDDNFDLNREFLAGCYRQKGSFVLKPAVSAGAYDTVLIDHLNSLDCLKAHNCEVSDLKLWKGNRSFLIQPFLKSVMEQGEWSLIFIGGEYSHCILKIPKSGDWRVQDELGGSVQWCHPSDRIKEVACLAYEKIPLAVANNPGFAINDDDGPPLYARIDILLDHQNEPVVSEIELIEPELFFLKRPPEGQEPFLPAIRLFSDRLFAPK